MTLTIVLHRLPLLRGLEKAIHSIFTIRRWSNCRTWIKEISPEALELEVAERDHSRSGLQAGLFCARLSAGYETQRWFSSHNYRFATI